MWPAKCEKCFHCCFAKYAFLELPQTPTHVHIKTFLQYMKVIIYHHFTGNGNAPIVKLYCSQPPEGDRPWYCYAMLRAGVKRGCPVSTQSWPVDAVPRWPWSRSDFLLAHRWSATSSINATSLFKKRGKERNPMSTPWLRLTLRGFASVHEITSTCGKWNSGDRSKKKNPPSF